MTAEQQRVDLLVAKLEILEETNPEAFRRIVRLIDKLADPCTDRAEIAREVSRAMGIPPGAAN